MTRIEGFATMGEDKYALALEFSDDEPDHVKVLQIELLFQAFAEEIITQLKLREIDRS